MMELFIENFLTLALIAFLGAVSPGPDFAVVSRNSLVYSRKSGLYTALGVSIGILVHMTYCISGIGLLIHESIFWFNLIRYCGACYLVYLGLSALLSRSLLGSMDMLQGGDQIEPYKCFKMGLIANILNPKATIFFLSIFTQFIKPSTPLLVQITYAVEVWLITLLWFIFLATFLSHPNLNRYLKKFQKPIEKVLGSLLIILGLKILF